MVSYLAAFGVIRSAWDWMKVDLGAFGIDSCDFSDQRGLVYMGFGSMSRGFFLDSSNVLDLNAAGVVYTA